MALSERDKVCKRRTVPTGLFHRVSVIFEKKQDGGAGRRQTAVGATQNTGAFYGTIRVGQRWGGVV